jgi:hypothetical protein
MLLAHKGELDNDPSKYRSYVYPRQLDEVVKLEMQRICDRIDLIRLSPMALHRKRCSEVTFRMMS